MNAFVDDIRAANKAMDVAEDFMVEVWSQDVYLARTMEEEHEQ